MINPVTKEIVSMNKPDMNSKLSEGLNNIAGEAIVNPRSPVIRNYKSRKRAPVISYRNYKILFLSAGITLLSLTVFRLISKYMNREGKVKRMGNTGYPDDVYLMDGKIRVSLTQDNDFEIFVNGGLARTIHVNGKPETPSEKEIYKVLREVGIEPELV
jgi:hypothetical protein